ncbi:MAG: hypothetical protein HGA49_12465 [Eubacteriaceae bacterium]|nr:hypothetical protein [Eubacteriaceae bacterium]
MKKYSAIFFICLFLIILSGCSNQESRYIFKGENPSWKVTYITLKNDTHRILEATYKKDLSKLSMKTIEILYKTETVSGSLNQTYDGDDTPRSNTFTLTSFSSPEIPVNKDQLIDVKIIVNGNLETVTLKSE